MEWKLEELKLQVTDQRKLLVFPTDPFKWRWAFWDAGEEEGPLQIAYERYLGILDAKAAAIEWYADTYGGKITLLIGNEEM